MKNYHYSLDNFLKLCRKSQELIFDNLEEYQQPSFFVVCGITDDIVNYSPIEQIFSIGNLINGINDRNGLIELCPQKELIVNGKRYIVDFYIECSVEYKDNEEKYYTLEKPIVIELDGKDYHSTTQQMNYDYERENQLKLAGYDVIRFTGSQVYNDVYGCLEKVKQFIKNTPKRVEWQF